MKIAMFTTWEPQECGIATYSRDLVNAHRARGHEVHVFAEMIRHTTRRDEFVHETWSRARPQFWFTRNDDVPGMEYDTKAWLSKIKPDVVHIQHELALWPDAEAFNKFQASCAASGARVVTTYHTVLPPPYMAGIYGLSQVGTNIVHRPEAALFFSGPVAVIPHGVVSRPRGHGDIDQAFARFITPGFMTRAKNQIEILEAFAEAVLREPHMVKITFIGRPQSPAVQAQLEGAIQDFGLGNHVEFIPIYVSEESLDKLVRGAVAVVLGATDEVYHYGASGQLARSVGLDVPVLAKDVPLYREPGGVLLWRDKSMLTRAMMKLVEGDGVLEDYLKQGSERMRQGRNWENISHAHEEVYR